ncbi:MAG: ABC transporter ATP-binding protein [Pseudomonadota bacterium]|nr:ABC transporter ATP-binding protein [Pseudomonadota bacterium]
MTVDLRCVGLSKNLGQRSVLRNLDLAVTAGEVVTLLGASGSGKTTLLRLISGLLEPESGTIHIGSNQVWGNGTCVPPERRRVAMVFQDYALWPHMTVEGNISFGLKAQRLASNEISARVSHALEVTQLRNFATRYPNELSGGQQQRVAIARCLAARPLLMLLDEPLSNLDASLRDDLRNEMMLLVRQEGMTAIYVTHDQAEAMAVSDRIAVMREGTIAQLDTPERLYEAPANAFVAGFLCGFSLLPGNSDGKRFRIDGSGDQIISQKNNFVGKAFLVVRPEDASPVTRSTKNQLRGIVTSSTYQGRCWRLTLHISNKTVRLDWPQSIEVGSELAFELPMNRCLLVGI